jgi:hypothetical protein
VVCSYSIHSICVHIFERGPLTLPASCHPKVRRVRRLDFECSPCSPCSLVIQSLCATTFTSYCRTPPYADSGVQQSQERETTIGSIPQILSRSICVSTEKRPLAPASIGAHQLFTWTMDNDMALVLCHDAEVVLSQTTECQQKKTSRIPGIKLYVMEWHLLRSTSGNCWSDKCIKSSCRRSIGRQRNGGKCGCCQFKVNLDRV